jgi:hypothetical protein
MATYKHAQLPLYARGTFAMVLYLFRAILGLAALAAARQNLFNMVQQQVVGVGGEVGPKGVELNNLAHSNGVILL